MRDWKKLVVLAGLLVVFLAVNLRQPSDPAGRALPARTSSARADTTSGPRIPDAELELEKLKPSTRVSAAEVNRNIFEYGRPERTAVAARPEPQPQQQAEAPPPPPPPKPPFRFYGFAENARSGRQRVFLTNGEDIFVVAEGDTVENKYRVSRVGSDSVELVELSGGRRWVLPLQEP